MNFDTDTELPELADDVCDRPAACTEYKEGFCIHCGYPSICHEY